MSWCMGYRPTDITVEGPPSQWLPQRVVENVVYHIDIDKNSVCIYIYILVDTPCLYEEKLACDRVFSNLPSWIHTQPTNIRTGWCTTPPLNQQKSQEVDCCIYLPLIDHDLSEETGEELFGDVANFSQILGCHHTNHYAKGTCSEALEFRVFSDSKTQTTIHLHVVTEIDDIYNPH